MKKIKLVLSLLVVVSMLAGAVPAFAAEEPVTINVYNWGQYISDGSDGYIDVNAAFTAETGIEVNYSTFDSNETMYTKLKTGGSSYDVIIPSDYMVARLIEEDMVQEINFDNIPNYEFVDEAYKNTDYDPDNLYSVPYTWGTVGVIYNTLYVDEADVGSWDLLWNEKYAGKILTFNNPRDAFAIAQSLSGIDPNTTSEDDLRIAADKLIEQKPVLQDYVMDEIFASMTNEEAYVAPYYAGDYLYMLEDNENLGFFHPEEGFNMFIDAMCIPTSSENKEAAEAYINFLCSPEISGQNLDYLGYSTPISEAKQYMDPEMASSEIAYPSAEVLEGSFSFLSLPTETIQSMDSLWLEVTTGETEGGSTGTMIAIAAAVVALLVIVVVLRSRSAKNRKAQRGKS